ncbi:protein-glutamate O-methyltransferase CheR [Rubellimicrobium rubrum]|uniref:Chemotaxis protein methyltransferase n=1 Tax=Rubellimicrobium rubrum TaxID=2585369 RepID=A0A5C4MKI0_9RHOB|nr:protein-glutamate O-methyltransferase CheR [Rubellimicrobium rubrum]TNC46228.1 protein-glutamate O-methyltransferase CheR [Rubellimicrobium rubrum]
MAAASPRAATEEEFLKLCDFLYRHTGLALTPAKRYYVDRRLAERMEATGAGSFGSYFATLRADVGGEMELLVNSLTVNETYFYREDHQLRCLTSSLLDPVARRKRRGEPIRIWSVPCSTGEEPYSIAIWLLENWPAVDEFEIEILGSDIDTRALAAARDGSYGKRALSRLSPDLVGKYFDPAGEERWQIIEGLRNSIQLTQANLVDGAEMARHGRFDVVFCRNVLIYFDDASRRIAAGNLYDALLPGGYICLGHAESMSRISSLFEVVRTEEAIVYRRPEEKAHD